MPSNRRLSLLLIAIVIFSNCIGIRTPKVQKLPQVQQGVLDLRNWNFSIDGAASLNGDWEYFPEKFDSLVWSETENKQYYPLGKDGFKMQSFNS